MSNEAAPQRERLSFIYIVRAIAILGVIAVHVTSTPLEKIPEYSSAYSIYNLLNVVFRFGTTTFIFLSAFVLFYNYYERKLSGRLLARFYKKRLLYIVIPYLIWSVFYYMFQLFLTGGWKNVLQHGSLSSLLDMIISGDAYYHLYFIYINVQFYIVFPLMLWLFRRFPRITRHLVWIGILLQAGFAIGNIYVFHFEDKGSLAISYVSYYFLGAYFGIHYDTVKDWFQSGQMRTLWRRAKWTLVWLCWVSAAALDTYLWLMARTENRYFDPLWFEFSLQLRSLLTILVLVHLSHIVLRHFQGKGTQALLHLGAASFGIYIVHAAVLSLYWRYISALIPVADHWVNAIAFAATLLVAWFVVERTTKSLCVSWLLFGQKPQVPEKTSVTRSNRAPANDWTTHKPMKKPI